MPRSGGEGHVESRQSFRHVARGGQGWVAPSRARSLTGCPVEALRSLRSLDFLSTGLRAPHVTAAGQECPRHLGTFAPGKPSLEFCRHAAYRWGHRKRARRAGARPGAQSKRPQGIFPAAFWNWAPLRGDPCLTRHSCRMAARRHIPARSRTKVHSSVKRAGSVRLPETNSPVASFTT